MINFSSEEKREGVRSNKLSHVLWFTCNLGFKADDLEEEFIGKDVKMHLGKEALLHSSLRGDTATLLFRVSRDIESKCLQDGFPHLSWTTSGNVNIRIDFQILIKPESSIPACSKSISPSLLGSARCQLCTHGAGRGFPQDWAGVSTGQGIPSSYWR